MGHGFTWIYIENLWPTLRKISLEIISYKSALNDFPTNNYYNISFQKKVKQKIIILQFIQFKFYLNSQPNRSNTKTRYKNYHLTYIIKLIKMSITITLFWNNILYVMSKIQLGTIIYWYHTSYHLPAAKNFQINKKTRYFKYDDNNVKPYCKNCISNDATTN